jgi:hypothetical protein
MVVTGIQAATVVLVERLPKLRAAVERPELPALAALAALNYSLLATVRLVELLLVRVEQAVLWD